MTNIPSLRQALLWAAGSPAAAFTLDPAQHEAFFDAVKRHRLLGRLVRRLRDGPPGAAGDLADEARRLHEAAAAQARTIVELGDRLGRAFREAGGDESLVLIKGYTLYALTGDPLTLRPMMDLDCNVANLDGFVAFMKRRGFQLIRPLDHLAEYAVLQSPEGYVELHSRFDVTSLPPHVRRDDVDPRRHGGVWEQRSHFRVRYVRHADFAAHLGRSSVVPDTIRPLRPELAALIQAAHMFKGFLCRPYPLPVATIPLDEVATFADFCRLPSFDAARFARIVDQFDGATAVRFARALAADLLGADPLGGDVGDRFFPTNLWWDGLDEGGFPVDAGWDPEQLVYRDRSIAPLVDRLSFTELSGSGACYAASFTLFNGNGSHAPRAIIRRDADSDFFAHCSASVSGLGLQLQIRLPKMRRDRMAAIALYLQDHRYEMFLNCDRRPPFTDYSLARDGEPAAVDRYSTGDAEIVQLRLPAHVVDHYRSDGVIDGFLVVREQIREWSRMTAGAAVPLRIHVPVAGALNERWEGEPWVQHSYH